MLPEKTGMLEPGFYRAQAKAYDMGTAAFILACFSGLTGMALFLAGYASLLTLNDQEQADLNRRLSQRPQRGWLNQWRHNRRVLRDAFPLSLFWHHWRDRPEVRRLFYWAMLFLFITCLLGQFARQPHP